MDESARQGRGLALRWLARRPLTESEIRDRLRKKEIAEDEVERTVAGLLEERLIDDRALADDYIVLRARRLHLGRDRLVRDLRNRGIAEEIAESAFRGAVERGDLDPEALLRDALARRIGRERERSTAARRRVYNALLRAGFSAAELYAELGRQWPNDSVGHGYRDDEGA
jgi:regulatory protein